MTKAYPEGVGLVGERANTIDVGVDVQTSGLFGFKLTKGKPAYTMHKKVQEQ